MSVLPYPLLRPLLFAADPEAVHDQTLQWLSATQHTPLRYLYAQEKILGIQVPKRCVLGG